MFCIFGQVGLQVTYLRTTRSFLTLWRDWWWEYWLLSWSKVPALPPPLLLVWFPLDVSQMQSLQTQYCSIYYKPIYYRLLLLQKQNIYTALWNTKFWLVNWDNIQFARRICFHKVGEKQYVEWVVCSNSQYYFYGITPLIQFAHLGNYFCVSRITL